MIIQYTEVMSLQKIGKKGKRLKERKNGRNYDYLLRAVPMKFIKSGFFKNIKYVHIYCTSTKRK